jgi:hypothetical protein
MNTDILLHVKRRRFSGRLPTPLVWILAASGVAVVVYLSAFCIAGAPLWDAPARVELRVLSVAKNQAICQIENLSDSAIYCAYSPPTEARELAVVVHEVRCQDPVTGAYSDCGSRFDYSPKLRPIEAGESVVFSAYYDADGKGELQIAVAYLRSDASDSLGPGSSEEEREWSHVISEPFRIVRGLEDSQHLTVGYIFSGRSVAESAQ